MGAFCLSARTILALCWLGGAPPRVARRALRLLQSIPAALSHGAEHIPYLRRNTGNIGTKPTSRSSTLLRCLKPRQRRRPPAHGASRGIRWNPRFILSPVRGGIGESGKAAEHRRRESHGQPRPWRRTAGASGAARCRPYGAWGTCWGCLFPHGFTVGYMTTPATRAFRGGPPVSSRRYGRCSALGERAA